jgi:hypothetical protein
MLTWWFGLMALGGLAFGLYAERRPFGDDVFAHPLIVFFVLVGAGLLLLRFVKHRPVPDILPERMLLWGCAVGVVAFLAGNWIGTRLVLLP